MDGYLKISAAILSPSRSQSNKQVHNYSMLENQKYQTLQWHLLWILGHFPLPKALHLKRECLDCAIYTAVGRLHVGRIFWKAKLHVDKYPIWPVWDFDGTSFSLIHQTRASFLLESGSKRRDAGWLDFVFHFLHSRTSIETYCSFLPSAMRIYRSTNCLLIPINSLPKEHHPRF